MFSIDHGISVLLQLSLFIIHSVSSINKMRLLLVLLVLLIKSLLLLVNSTTECKFPIYSTGAAEGIPVSILSRNDQYGDSPLGVPLRENMMEYLRKDFRKLHKLQRHMINPEDAKWKQTSHGNNVTIVFLGGGLCAGAIGRNIDQVTVESNHLSSSSIDTCQQINAKYSKSCHSTTVSNKPCKSCSYAARFQVWLQKAYPHLNINIYNLGAVGTNSQISLGNIANQLQHLPKPIDVVVLDFTEADQYGSSKSGTDNEAEVLISASFERLVRYFSYTHRAVVINLEHSTYVSTSGNNNNNILDVNSHDNNHVTTSHDPSIIVPPLYRYHRYRPHDTVINKYELPTLRYEEHAFFNTSLLGQEMTYFHHQLLANHLSFLWYKEAMKVCINMHDHKEHSYTHVSTMTASHDTAHPHHDHHMDHHRVPIITEHKAVQDKLVGPVV